ncbi:MAG: homocysteine S-methyltransferase [Deltaproteobacteria bacterium]|nr:homocysteine S-methyltransferase [Deltaproteobacteria bacterium]
MTLDPLGPLLADDATMLLDGGLATELTARGHDLDDPLWSAKVLLDEPAAIEQVHDDYLRAGADVAIAATYQASLPGLRARGLSSDQARALLERAVGLARRACDRAAAARPGRPRPLAIASLGAYGAYLADGSEYRGEYSIDDAGLARYHRERLEIVAPHADLVACETIPCLREAQCLARVLTDVPVPAWIAFCCRDGAHVGHGEPIEACAAAIAAVPSVVAVGINCTAPRYVEPLVTRLRAVTDRPIVVYPNAGERYEDGQWCGSRTTPAQMVALAQRWHGAGARIVGGCCRTTPGHVAALHQWRQRLCARS